MEKTNLLEKVTALQSYFSPHIVDELENMYVKVAKIKGHDFPWHKHDNEDEMFLVLEGELKIEFEDQATIFLSAHEMFVVRKDTMHKVSAEEECKIVLIEKKSTEHTGGVLSHLTKTLDQQKKPQ